jgi:uncharacterized protein YecT (DUF1311 family)
MIVIAALITAVASASAASPVACPGSTQTEMNICASDEFRAADARLNAAWRSLTKSADLLKAQRAWITFRDADCAFQANPYQGGSIQSLIRSTCMTGHTQTRTQQLLEFKADQDR